MVTDDVSAAAEIIRGGGLVAFPTETVYGLGANAFDDRAVEKIFSAKGRPADNPLIVHVADRSQIDEIAAHLTDEAEAFIERFFPGALTIVALGTGRVSRHATCGLPTVAFRMPSNSAAQGLIRAAGTPLVAPSANISGRPSPTTWSAVAEDMSGKIECILKGEPTEIGLESTVVDCVGDVPVVLRTGAVSLEHLRAVAPATRMMDDADAKAAARSPGLRHRHYSPRARVIIFRGDTTDIPLDQTAYIGIGPPTAQFAITKICSSPEEYARSMFEFFRECDRLGLTAIYCQEVSKEGIGAAIMDRLDRAAAG